MRLSRFPLATAKETPADAEVVSHQLMQRAGYIRKLGSGLYTWMPIGLRVLRNIERIVREEMNRAGAVELLMPSIQPAELWQQSGRWTQMGAEMLRMQDRHGNDFCYGPTHEEVIVHHVKQDVRSYKQLPVNYYQVQTKFRDERRPRFGVMRAREFLMKDAYSFDTDEAGLVAAYGRMREAYIRIFDRLGIDYRIVQADAGNIGGNQSEEFHVLAGSGEDLLAVSDSGPYAANVEAAVCAAPGPRVAATRSLTDVATPGQRTCEQVATFLKVPLSGKVKLLVVRTAEGVLRALALRGDHQLNEVKAARHPAIGAGFTLADPDEVATLFGCEVGYLGPVNCPLPVIADHAAAAVADFVCGANRKDFHLQGVNWGRDCPEPETADLRNVVEGDPSPDGVGQIRFYRGIEGGHIFQLGRKYTEAMGLTVLDEQGQALVPWMGCYGIGVSRLAAAIIEQRHDERGMIWPLSVAPFPLIICPIGLDKSEAVKTAAESLYSGLQAAGVDVLIDDRGLRPGGMFADAELVGIPLRVTIGDKALADNQFEFKRRDAADAERIPATVDAVLAQFRG
ncbi:proline--tRNA ligase [Flagellatimonas centrodinii]|uniref:proline--tRNA ligase n=1 Tax=Flagellatimonas centrodinii TaxID=2806210 RepID=UPI001FED576B|nr:proline--tRNA ligase [Flagellatimonas centrodinii]ULQ45718.1 proline--tRNA ligase [Flagellatimonas centrodinii]